MEALLQLVLSPENVRVYFGGDGACNKYCLTRKEYRIFPKEIKDENGNTVTRFIKCGHFGVDFHDSQTYHQYETAVKNYLATTSDPIGVMYFRPREKAVHVAKPEYADIIKQTEEARQQHQNKVDQLIDKFGQDLAALGADGFIDHVHVVTWPEYCQLKDEWYETHQEMDCSECQINLTFHSETELYRVLIARKVLHDNIHVDISNAIQSTESL